MAPLIINGNVVDFDSSHPKNILFAFGTPSSSSDYILVKTKRDLSKRELAELRDLDAQFQEYVADNLYLFRYIPADLTPIREKAFVEKAGVYAKGLKVNSQLQRSREVDPKLSQSVNVVLHEDKFKGAEEIVPELARRAGVPESDIVINGNQIQMTVENDKLDLLAGIDSVRTIEALPQKVLFNTIARGIMDAEVTINNTPYNGDGQVVAVADTGLDNGKVKDIHPSFKGRVVELIPIGRSSRTDDTDGHGTHVCGSVLGGTVNGVQGIASEAKLVMQSLLNEQGGLFPRDGYPLTRLFVEPYKQHKAHIHSNSWGSRWTGRQLPYSDESKEIDACVWDNPDLLICFAAGNDGHETNAPTLGAQAAAKNCLTVGATESSRPSIDGRFIPGKKSANDATEISWYSSRGPTLEGRIKPDIVAPGTAILSAKSSMSPEAAMFGPSPDPLFTFSTGTSMATPLVAGAAAVLRQVLVQQGIQKPSAALLKALLINGAFTLHHAHSSKEGFGRVNLQNSIIVPGQTDTAGFITGLTLEDRGDHKSFPVQIPEAGTASNIARGLSVSPPAGAGVTLKVTLVYTDAPGAKLQNDLNLIVRTSDGAERHGNMGSSGGYDHVNNVEQIIWKGIPSGKAEIIVRASRVLSEQQDFVVVWRIIPTEA